MERKNRKISPEARQAYNDFKMEIAGELAIPEFNNMTRSEYPAYVKPEDREMVDSKGKRKKFYNHDLYY